MAHKDLTFWQSFDRLIHHPRLWIKEHFDEWEEDSLSKCQTGTLNSVTRDTWVSAQLRALPSGWRILDAGAGEQRYRPECSHLSYVSQDHMAYDGTGDGVGGHIPSWSYGKTDIVCDISKIPEQDASFDAVLCTEVIEHVPDPRAALAELARLVRPGGRIILSAPFYSFTHFAPYHFCTGFSKYWYQTHLEAIGFYDICCECNGNFFEVLAQELRRLQEMTRQYHGKPLTPIVRVAIVILLSFLGEQSRVANDSGPYACMGWHVTGTKKST